MVTIQMALPIILTKQLPALNISKQSKMFYTNSLKYNGQCSRIRITQRKTRIRYNNVN